MDLKKFDRTITLRLLILLGISLILSFIYERSSFKSITIDLALILYLILSIIYSIIATIIGKNNICIKYNLKCSQCGKVPKAFFAISAMKSGKCPGCGNKLGTYPPLHLTAGKVRCAHDREKTRLPVSSFVGRLQLIRLEIIQA